MSYNNFQATKKTTAVKFHENYNGQINILAKQ